MLPELIVDELANTKLLDLKHWVESLTVKPAFGNGLIVRLVPLSVPVTVGLDAMTLIL